MMEFISWTLFIIFCITYVCKLFKKIPIGTILLIAGIVAGSTFNRDTEFFLCSGGGLLLGLIIQFFYKDVEKRGRAFNVLIATILYPTIIFGLGLADILDFMDSSEETLWLWGIALLIHLALCNIPFNNLIPYFSDDTINIKDLDRSERNDFVKKHFIVIDLALIAIATGLASFIFGAETTFNAFENFFESEGTDVILSIIYIFGILRIIIAILCEYEWKIEENMSCGLLMLLIGFVICTHMSNHFINNPAPEDNWYITTLESIETFFNNIMPDWFFAKGWLNIWGIIRAIIGLIFSVTIHGVVLGYPFFLIYEQWHKKRDMCSTSYEWTTALVFYPIFITTIAFLVGLLRIDSRFWQWTLYIVSTFIFMKYACLRKRCKKCGSTNLWVYDRWVQKSREEQVGKEKEVLNLDGKDVAKRDKNKIFEQHVWEHSKWRCQRCGHCWGETSHSVKKRKETIHGADWEPI